MHCWGICQYGGGAIFSGCFLLLVQRKESMVVAYLFGMLLYSIARIDQRSMHIPDRLSGGVLLCAIVKIAGASAASLWTQIGGLSVSLILYGIVRIYPDSIGGGDIKLCAAGGLYLGWQRILPAFCIAVWTATIFAGSLYLLQRLDKDTRFPFGPFLCMGMGIGMFLP